MKKLAVAVFFLFGAIFASMFMSMNVFALTEGDWEYQLLGNQAVITKYTGDDENVVIPDTIAGVPVTEVTCKNNGDNYFNNGIIKSVTFPSTVKVIHRMCYGSSTLESVILPEGVEEIADLAFTNCTNLKNITLPSTLKKIGSSAFASCTSLSSINFPASLEVVSNGVFSKSGLENVDMSACINLKDLDTSMFRYCTSLRTVLLPYGFTEVKDFMFGGCTSLVSIDLPATVTSIGMEAFYGCTSLEDVILPVSLKELGRYAFKECVAIEEVIVPYGTERVDAAFQDCTSLKAVYVPDTVSYLSLSILNGSKNAIIYCMAGSEAEKVCQENGISYLNDNSVNTLINVLYNGKRISFNKYGKNPEMINDRTFVPLRSIFEAMNATVDWDGSTKTVTAARGDVIIKINIGASEMYKNGTAIPIDVPAQLVGDFTMVPVRFIAEAFDAQVEWNGNGRLVLINE
jgi:hypothetical protein